MEREKKIIVITGQDGCGKSTLINNLVKTVSNSYKVTIWDALDLGLFDSKEKVGAYLVQLSPNARLMFLSHALTQSMEMAYSTKKSVLFVDGYYYKYFASELALGADKVLADNLSSLFPKPDKILKLNLTPEIAFKRKQKLTPYECGLKQMNEINFIDFQNKVKSHWEKFEQKNWNTIEASQTELEVLNTVTSLL